MFFDDLQGQFSILFALLALLALFFFRDLGERDRNWLLFLLIGFLWLSLGFIFLSNPTYRLACLLGLIAMVMRGGERRMLAVAAAGTHVIYVVLTCAFYFVGLAYENVSEVTRFILFIGAIDSALYLALRAFSHSGVGARVSAISDRPVPSSA